MRGRGLAAAAIVAVAAALASTGIGSAADRGREATAAAGKAPKQTANYGRRGRRGPAGPAGKPGKEGARGKMGPVGAEGPVGPEGPDAILSIENLTLGPSDVNHAPTFAFIGQTVTKTFDARTAAHVTASLDFASRDGKKIEAAFAICAKPAGRVDMFAFKAVNVAFQAAAENFFAQTATAVLEGLGPGTFTIGACTAQETMNTGHGLGTETAIFAEAEGPRPS